MPVIPYPRPRSMTTRAGGAAFDAPVVVAVDDTLPAQGYRLHTGPAGIDLHHRDAAGLRHGLQTLDQLRADQDFSETGYEIADHPDFAVRGFMLDISRDRAPTRRTLERWLSLLSLARFNQLELYCEHTYAYRDHQEVWQDASPLTAEDLRWLDARCAAHGIDLVANQNTFGHMERFLGHATYAHRAENPDGFERGGAHCPPGTLAPTEDNAAFVTALLEEMTGNLRTRRVNIGADEPFELGTGHSRDQAARDGVGDVYLTHLERIMRPWLDAGYTVQFWADVFAEHPELMDRVPQGAVPVIWQYDSPRQAADVIAADTEELRSWQRTGSDVDQLRDGFRGRAEVLREAGIAFWVAPGAGNWNSLIGRLDNAMENMVDAAEAGLEHGAEGYLLTSWGDQGMWDPPSITFGPAVFGGAVSWCLQSNRDLDIAAVLNDHVLLDATGLSGTVLDRLGRITRALDPPLLNASPLARVLLPDPTCPMRTYPSPQELDAAATALAACRLDLTAAEPAAGDGDVLLRELDHAIALAQFAVRLLRARAQARAEATAIDPTTAHRLLRELEPLLAEQRSCWLLRSRPGGLDDSIARFDRLRHQLQSAARQ